MPYKDIAGDLSLDSRGFIAEYEGPDAIKESIKNAVLTLRGEVIMDPGFGSLLHRSLFENLTEENAFIIRNTVKKAIMDMDSRLSPGNLKVRVSADSFKEAFVVEIYFSFGDSQQVIRETL